MNIVDEKRKDILEYIKRTYINGKAEILKVIDVEPKKIIDYADKTLDEVLIEVRNKYKDDVGAWIEETSEKLKNRMRVNQSRWIKAILEDEKSDLNIKHAFVELEFRTLEKKEFVEKYKVDNPDKYKNKLIDEMQKWRDKDSNLLIDFPYIVTKPKRTLTTSYRTDIENIICNYINDYYKKTNISSKDIVTTPLLLLDIASNTGNNKKMKHIDISNIKDLQELISNQNQGDLGKLLVDNMLLGDIYKTGQKSGIISFIESGMKDGNIDKKKINELATLITAEDRSVFTVIINYMDAHFFKDRTISFPLNRLAKDIYGDKINGRSYNNLLRSIQKLQMIKFQVYANTEDSEKYSSFGLIDHLEIINDKKTNRIDVKVSISLPVSEQITTEKIVKVFKEPLNSLENKHAKVLVYKLQADRIAFLSLDEKIVNPIMSMQGEYRVFGMEFFEAIIHMEKKYRYRNVNLIEDALEDLRRNNLIVDQFYREGYMFYIKYLPITNREAEKLLIGMDNQKYTIDKYEEIGRAVSKYHND